MVMEPVAVTMQQPSTEPVQTYGAPGAGAGAGYEAPQVIETTVTVGEAVYVQPAPPGSMARAAEPTYAAAASGNGGVYGVEPTYAGAAGGAGGGAAGGASGAFGGASGAFGGASGALGGASGTFGGASGAFSGAGGAPGPVVVEQLPPVIAAPQYVTPQPAMTYAAPRGGMGGGMEASAGMQAPAGMQYVTEPVATGAPPPVEPVQTYEAPAPVVTQGPVTVAPPVYVERAAAPPPVEPVQGVYAAGSMTGPSYAAGSMTMPSVGSPMAAASSMLGGQASFGGQATAGNVYAAPPGVYAAGSMTGPSYAAGSMTMPSVGSPMAAASSMLGGQASFGGQATAGNVYAAPPVQTTYAGASQSVDAREVIKEVPVVQVQTVERIQEVPQVQIQEVIREVPTVQVEEVIKQVIVPQYQEVIKHVPVPQIQTVEKIVEIPQMRVNTRHVQVPQIQTVEVIKQVIKEEVREVIREVPKIQVQTVEKIVEVPQVQYQERIVEVVEHQVDEVINQVPVPVVQEVVRHVPKIQVQTVEKIVSVPQVQVQERVVEIPQVQCVYLPAEEPAIDMMAPTDTAFSNSVMVGATMRDLPGGSPQVVQTEQGPMLMEPVATGVPGAPVTMTMPSMSTAGVARGMNLWNEDCTFRLCDDSDIQQYKGRTTVFEKTEYQSVTQAVAFLNGLPGGGQDSWVVVFSQSHGCWYVLYKVGSKETALQHFGL
ncbi:unnamed protein product [Prorocentrum cordatum]|uniref:Subtilisin n=1 Tax=Prorocentrum cordatum TaxID=2364126 RepID=A0ABN9VH42_9DINO|nr:unnamed protein product [Polarella glacialis]